MENIDETSPEFEPLTSVFDNDDSNDESISGMSDLVSVGSPIQFISKENHDNGFETDKSSIEKLQEPHFDKNGIINHKSDSVKSINENKMLNNSEKFKTNDLKSKRKHNSSRTSINTSSQEKSSRSKDRNSNSHRSTSGEKNYMKIIDNTSSNDRKNSSSHSRHHSKDKNKKYKHDKKSHHNDCDRTPKRDSKDSRSDKKEKSSSLCKEPKSLNDNRSDDESNAGGSSKQKSNMHKNKSSTSDKSKSSSNNHKNSRKNNGGKDVDNKPKEKLSLSKNYTTLSHKNNRTKRKKHRLSLKEENSRINKKHNKWSDLRSMFITNDEQDAANVLLSMSNIPYENTINEIRTENIILLENSSTINHELKIQENINHNKNVQSNSNDSIKDDLKYKTSELFNSNNSSDFKDSVPKINVALSCRDIKIQNKTIENVEIKTEHNNQIELVMDEKEQKTLNVEDKSNSDILEMSNKCNANVNLKVPKLKLKLLSNKINSTMKGKRKIHHTINHTNYKKFKSSKSDISSSAINVSIIDTPTNVIYKQNDQNLNYEIEINESKNTSDQIYRGHENRSLQIFNDDQSLNTFRGFSQLDAVPCENYERIKILIKTLQNKINCNAIIDGFKGFTDLDLQLYNKRDIVHSQLRKLKNNLGFIGFTEKDTEICNGYKHVKQQLQLAKKQNYINNHQKNITCGGNGKTLNKVMTIIYGNNKDNGLNTDENYKQPNNNNQNNCPVVNNNNDITTSDDWVAEQETKYKLLPLKVKLERLMEYRCNGKYIFFNTLFIY